MQYRSFNINVFGEQEGKEYMEIILTAEEARVLYDLVEDEQRCVVNEYDSNTGRRPGRKRMQNKPQVISVTEKILKALPKNGGGSRFVDLDAFEDCILDISDRESFCVRHLLEDCLNDCKKALATTEKPYAGAYADIEKAMEAITSVLKKLTPQFDWSKFSEKDMAEANASREEDVLCGFVPVKYLGKSYMVDIHHQHQGYGRFDLAVHEWDEETGTHGKWLGSNQEIQKANSYRRFKQRVAHLVASRVLFPLFSWDK